MDTSGPEILVPVKYDSTLGALLLGGVGAVAIWAVTCAQTYEYYMYDTKRDGLPLKLLVALLWLLDTFDTALNIHMLYFYLVVNFINPLGLVKPVWYADADIRGIHFSLTGEFFLFWQEHHYTCVSHVSNENLWLTGGIWMLSITDLAIGIIITVKAFRISSFIELVNFSETRLFKLLRFQANATALSVDVCQSLPHSGTLEEAGEAVPGYGIITYNQVYFGRDLSLTTLSTLLDLPPLLVQSLKSLNSTHIIAHPHSLKLSARNPRAQSNMETAPAPALLTKAFDNTLGALLLGGLAAMMWVMTIPLASTLALASDSVLTNFISKVVGVSVAVLWVMDSLHTAFNIHTLYFYMVTNYNNPQGLIKPVWSIITLVALTAVSNFIIRAVYIKRIYWFAALFVTAKAFTINDFFELGRFQVAIYLSFGASIVCDLLLAIAPLYLLYNSRTGFQGTDGIIRLLMMYIINTGVVVAIDASLGMVTYAMMPDNFIFLGFYLILSKFYLNAYLATLNARKSIYTEAAEKASKNTLKTRGHDSMYPLQTIHAGHADHTLTKQTKCTLSGIKKSTASVDPPNVITAVTITKLVETHYDEGDPCATPIPGESSNSLHSHTEDNEHSENMLAVTSYLSVLPNIPFRTMDTSAPGLLLPVKYDNTLGALLLGSLGAAVIWAVTCTQTYEYYMHDAKRDGLRIKLLVAMLWILDTFDTAINFHMLYFYLVVSFAKPLDLLKPIWCADNNANTCDTQTEIWIFDAFRVLWQECYLSNKNVWLTGAVWLISIVDLGISIAITVEAFGINTFIELDRYSSLIYATFGVGTGGDFLITVILCTLLYQRRTGFQRTDNLIRTLTLYTISTGMVVVIDSILCVSTYAAMPGNFIYLGFYLSYSKLHVNAYLATLNARKYRRAQHDDTFLQYPADNNAHASFPMFKSVTW
ncbi:hypothetical protein CVT24_005843 [Panaeolus cyanescens]|uniref:DUF6534 domain-containing protein n=1 Tax=Panaeolus cyanescens TaxID=181874 RepID=A0A409YF55_9AGAR|nr:hypothetical protein CVT24_005843 [Panaeolus cyanescens]